MSATSPDAPGSDAPESDADDFLVELYRRYLGEPERRVDVYLGFGLFFGGIALGFAGFALFVGERVLAGGAEKIYPLREVAFSVGALGLPLLLSGVVVLLPVDRRARYGAGTGLAFCLAAVAFFVSVYPRNWDVTVGTDYSLQGVAIYAVGLGLLLATTAAALVSYHIERARRPVTIESGVEIEREDVDPDEVEEQVRADIDEVMAESDISWGGVRKTEHRRISVETPDIDDADRSGFDDVEATTVRSSGSDVEDAVASLQGVREGTQRTDRSEDTVDDQAAALAELRRQQQADDEESPADRIRRMLGL